MRSFIQDEDEDDDSDADDDTDSELDETALESYTTPIDDESTDNPIDEFVTFQQVMTSKSYNATTSDAPHQKHFTLMSDPSFSFMFCSNVHAR